MAHESTASMGNSMAPSGAVGSSTAHANMRHSDDFNRATRHSRLVTILRTALPLSAVATVIVFVSMAFTSQLPIADVKVDEVSLKEGRLVMENPNMAGFDKNSQPYDVKAVQAIQDLSQPGKVLLTKIDAKLPVDASSFAKIVANSGVYNTNDEKLFLNENVAIRGARGMDMMLEDADIDIRSGTMESDNPVTANSNNTNISADSIRVEEGGNRIVFNKRVKMTIIRPTERGTDGATQQKSRQP